MGFFDGLFGEPKNCCAKCEYCVIGSPDGVHRCYMCNNGGYYNKYLSSTPILGYKRYDIISAPPCGGDERIYKHWNSGGEDDGTYNPQLLGCYDLEEPQE